MSGNLSVSVCMITYNHAPFIAEAIEGVLRQEPHGGTLRLIIADDGSTDGTSDVVAAYEGRYPETVRAILQPRNQGMQRNFRDALGACEGQFIALCEGDDYWTDIRKIRRQVEFFASHPKHVMCFHDVRIQKGDALFPSVYRQPVRVDLNFNDLAFCHMVPTCSVLFRRDAFPAEYPEFMLLLPMADIPLELIVADRGPVRYMGEAMAVYRQHAGSITRNAMQKRKGRRGYIDLYRELRRMLGWRRFAPLAYCEARARLGIIKDVLGLNPSLRE